ncbi:hypothetical protein BC939DRAFT_477288 [Gamsiella multidivaricata]|uniref:uncharacterized protein n=1 Tax=Gamsiella multidivaricata TaxID=101098 RepID=UPI00221F9238|nr:uncharacterized protein BC939DRAFT_477288 [Gamsiella multidivaricata]KAI7823392.1 hypothetical protein BC939DRAFT_477288 [Gamsiella multidivaricata]
MAGFGAGGIVAGIPAAAIMATYGGTIGAGSECTILQAFGAIGLGATEITAAAEAAFRDHKNSTTTAVPSVGTGKSDGAEAGLVYALAAAVILAAILREMRARNGDSEYGESEDNDKKSEDGKDSMSNSASAIETHELNVADTVFGGTLGSATDNSRAPTADELGPALDCPANGQEGVDGAGTTSDVSTETGVGYDDDDGEGKQKRQK